MRSPVAKKKEIAKMERQRLKELAERKKKSLEDLHAKHNKEAAASDEVAYTRAHYNPLDLKRACLCYYSF